MPILDLSHALVDGFEFSTKHYNGTLRLHNVGELFLPTGNIVATDPFVVPEQEPFTKNVKPGNYPVILSVADISSDQRVAYAVLQFTETPAVKWELAITSNQNVDSLQKDEFFGYGVDSGTGCFMDAEVAQLIAGIDYPKSEEWFDEVSQKMDETYIHTWSYVNTIIIPETNANLIAFSSGFGDGAYPSYFGYDSLGNLVRLVTDFGVLYEDSED